MTLDHKHMGQFLEIEIYASYESFSENIWLRYIWKSGIWGCKKIAFKAVQMKFLAMHITNQILSFDIFMVGNLQNIFMEHDLYLIS